MVRGQNWPWSCASTCRPAKGDYNSCGAAEKKALVIVEKPDYG